MKNYLTLAFFLITGSLFGQGVTTSSIHGTVRDAEGMELIGANITAVHQPTGSFYGASTNVSGIFRMRNMQSGGPYIITISYTGYEDFVFDQLNLSLGEDFQLNTKLQESSTQLETVVITENRSAIINSNRTGQSSTVNDKLIETIPTISRALADYVRFNPLADVREETDGFQFSIAGQNNRYNAIYFDGVISNDVFGLADSGTNGGQTGVQPVSIFAIDQIQINVAPFDVSQSGFSGGSVNAVTKSGTNKIKGEAYYFLRNESLAGKTPTDNLDEERTKLPDFSATTFGLNISGPLVKDKAFFFLSTEVQRDDTPQPFQFADYNGDSSQDAINQLSQFTRDQFGYETGGFTQNTSYLNSEKILAKVNINLNKSNKLVLRHSYVNAENLEARRSSPFSINFINGSEYFVSKTHSTAVELNSIITPNISNQLKLGGNFVRDDRDPLGSPFPTISIEDGNSGSINIGAETFSTANLLNQDVVSINNELTIFKRKHNIKIGFNAELYRAANLFIADNYGVYNWEDNDSISAVDQYLLGLPAARYSRGYSQVDNVAGDETEAIADFRHTLLGLYIQDEFQVNDQLKLTAGLRVDVPMWPTDQPVNEDFNNNTIPLIESFGYDLQGARTGEFIDNQFLFAPRLGFNYISTDKKTQLRGGLGVFTSRIPLVWLGGAYNNYGFNIGSSGGENIDFVADVQNQPIKADLENPAPSGNVELFSDDFKLPQVLKANVAVDRQLPWGLTGTLELLYTKNINALKMQNFNLKPSTRNLIGVDNRPLWEGSSSFFGDDVIAPEYSYITLSSNTSKGYAYNVAFTLNKSFGSGIFANVSYSYGDSYSTFDGSSSRNQSLWRGYHNVQGKNFEGDPQRSFYAAGHRVYGQFSYEVKWAEIGKSTFSFSLNGETGDYFTYVVQESNFRFVDDGGFSNNELMWVPENIDQINLVPITVDDVEYSALDQWEILDDFIENDPHLSTRRGDYSERNGRAIPFQFNCDVRFLQDFNLKFKNGITNRFQLSLDIFNLTNLINQDWGRRRFAGSFGNYGLVALENSTNSNFIGENQDKLPEYSVNPDIVRGEKPWTSNIDDSGLRSSRWQMQIGLRYIFN